MWLRWGKIICELSTRVQHSIETENFQVDDKTCLVATARIMETKQNI